MSTAVAWTVAGSDSGAGAGIQADLKTMSAFGVYGCSVITAVTAQNTRCVSRVESVSPELLREQLRSLGEDIMPGAVKLGMLHNSENMRIVSEYIGQLSVPVVCDPVMASTSGNLLMDSGALIFLRDQVMPRSTLITPNIDEAERLAGFSSSANSKNVKGKERDDYVEMLADVLLKHGAKAVLIKGGQDNGEFSQDFFSNGMAKCWLTSERFPVASGHGSGCTLSAAIASALASNFSLLDALVIAKAYVNQGFRQAPSVGSGHAPLGHQTRAPIPTDLPWSTRSAQAGRARLRFAEDEDLGFYPIIDRAEKLPPLIAAGVRTVQLRIKDLQDEALLFEIESAVRMARNTSCRLYVNDYWEAAIASRAFGVHLGQEDLETARCDLVASSGLRLGISTHCHYEVAKALAFRPSYIAIGPIFETPTKKMNFPPQGMSSIRYWRSSLAFPLVAIGGLNLENASEALAHGADSVCVVRDINNCAHPEQRALQWLKLFVRQESHQAILV